MKHKKTIFAVCFDYRGTLLNHNSDRELVPGMENLLAELKKKQIPMALVSRFPADELTKRLGSLMKYFNEHIYSGGGKAKLDCIKTFAQKLTIDDLSQIAFIDDKPENFVPVAQNSEVFVIGFKGSGKYPHVETVCKDMGIAYATTAKELENLLFRRTGM